MKMTLEDFAELINNADEWSDEFYDIIKENGWHDDTHTAWGICSDGKYKLEFNEYGKAVVI